MHLHYFRGAFAFCFVLAGQSRILRNQVQLKKYLFLIAYPSTFSQELVFSHIFIYMLNFPILSLFAKRVLSIKIMERFWNVSTPHMEHAVHIMPY